MSEKQIDEQILENEVSNDKTKINSTENEVADSKEIEERIEEKDPFLERIKKLDNNERIFEKDEYFKTSEDEAEDEIKNAETFDESENKIKEKLPVTREKKKKGKAIKIIAPVIILGIILCALLPGVINSVIGNKYNPMGYPVIEGKTFGDAAKVYNCSYKKFLKDNNFPSDIPKDTPIFVAEYYMRVKDIAEKNYSMDYETFKNEVGIPESATLKNGKTVKINENTMWYIVKDELPLSSIIKEKDFLEYKTYYGLSDEVTPVTLYKEVRPQIEKVLVEEVKVKYGLIEEPGEENPENIDSQIEETTQTEEEVQTQTESTQTPQTEQTAPAEVQPDQTQSAE